MWSNPFPQISIVIAVKNAHNSLQKCIDSIRCQTYQDMELLIMDGGSEDGTVEIINKNSQYIAYWESRQDRGIAHAWNKALRHTKGQWILFIGADDTLRDKLVLEKAATSLIQASRLGKRLAYGKVELKDQKGNHLQVLGQDWGKIKERFFTERDEIPHPACFHHSSLFEDYGPFDQEFLIAMDYEFLIRVLLREEPFFMDEIITTMAFGGLSHHPATLLQTHNEAHMALLRHGLTCRNVKFTINHLAYKILGALLFFVGEKAARWYLDTLRIVSGKSRVWTIDG